MNYIAQGDVILKPIKKLPKGLKKVDHKVLQHGETTGNMHKFLDSDTVEVYIDESQDPTTMSITPNEHKYIVVGNTAYLRHEEHNPVKVEPGVYEIDIVLEYDYDTHEARRVID